ncbi:MAG: hypothetical protein ACO27M_04930 [Vulcanococcus sp.]
MTSTSSGLSGSGADSWLWRSCRDGITEASRTAAQRYREAPGRFGGSIRWVKLRPSDDRPPALARFYAKNRRDGARLLSSALVITSVGLVRIDHPAGQVVTAVGALVCLYWWSCYRQLER